MTDIIKYHASKTCFMSFTTKELIFLALAAALLFVLNFSIGAVVIAVTNIPLTSGFVTGITNMIVVTVVVMLLKRPGAATILCFIYSLIALPTPMAGGPPGFIWKVPLLTFGAFLFDLALLFIKNRKLAIIIGLPIMTVITNLLYVLTFYLLGMPEYKKMLAFLPLLCVSFVLLGYLGMWIGFMIYNRIRHKKIVQQISS